MFTFETPHTVRRSGGQPIPVTIPVEFPPAVVVGGLEYTFERQGYRLPEGTPAGYYRADDGSGLWLCDGSGQTTEGEL